MSFWKNDNFFVGITVGFLLTVLTALIIILVAPIIYDLLSMGESNPKLLILSFVPAVLMMRYYMRKLNFGKSGSGTIFIVFIGIFLYFLLVAGKLYTIPSIWN